MAPALEIVDTAAEAAEQELAPLIVREPLAAYLDGRGLGSGPVEAERIGEGHSNVTYLIHRGEERFVLRRPPRPPLPPSAHDVLRESRLLRGDYVLNREDIITKKTINGITVSTFGVPPDIILYAATSRTECIPQLSDQKSKDVRNDPIQRLVC